MTTGSAGNGPNSQIIPKEFQFILEFMVLYVPQWHPCLYYTSTPCKMVFAQIIEKSTLVHFLEFLQHTISKHCNKMIQSVFCRCCTDLELWAGRSFLQWQEWFSHQRSQTPCDLVRDRTSQLLNTRAGPQSPHHLTVNTVHKIIIITPGITLHNMASM